MYNLNLIRYPFIDFYTITNNFHAITAPWPGREPRRRQRPSGHLASPRGRPSALHACGGEGRTARSAEDGGGTFAEE